MYKYVLCVTLLKRKNCRLQKSSECAFDDRDIRQNRPKKKTTTKKQKKYYKLIQYQSSNEFLKYNNIMKDMIPVNIMFLKLRLC